MQRSINDVADEILDLQGRKKALEAQIELIDEEVVKRSVELQKLAEKEGLTLGKGERAKWTLEPRTVPTIVDWDAFVEYITETGNFHMLQRRPSVKAAQEAWGMGMVIPGIEKYTSTKVTVKGV